MAWSLYNSDTGETLRTERGIPLGTISGVPFYYNDGSLIRVLNGVSESVKACSEDAARTYVEHLRIRRQKV